MIQTQTFVGAHRAEHPQEVGAMLTKPPGNAGEARRGLLVFGAATLWSVSHYRKLFMEAKDNQKLAGDSEIRTGGWSQMFSRSQNHHRQPPEGWSWWAGDGGAVQAHKPILWGRLPGLLTQAASSLTALIKASAFLTSGQDLMRFPGCSSAFGKGNILSFKAASAGS